MSPEQATGKRVDKRADIWSFGVVLWEMLSGQRLFEGETVSHTLADVLRAEIDFAKLPRTTPAPIRDLLKRCLDRDLKTRLRDIGEARIAIQKYQADPVGQAILPPATPRALGLAWGVAGLLFAGLAGLALVHFRQSPTPRPLVRLDVDLGPDMSLGSQGGADVILSPDGNRLVYVSQSRLFTRRLDQPKATELAGADGASAPFFSPDGQWVAFSAGGKLKKISLEGGAPVDLCSALPSSAAVGLRTRTSSRPLM